MTKQQKQQKQQWRQVDVQDILPMRDNPRKTRDPEKYQALKESIRRHGVHTPVWVAPVAGGKWQLLAGAGRLRALQEIAEECGQERLMPIQIMSVEGSAGLKILALMENLLREDLSIADEVGAVADLVDEGMTLEAIAEGVGMSVQWVRQRRLLALAPPPLFSAVSLGKVTKAQAVEICSLPDAEVREEVTRRVLEPAARLTPLSPAETRELIETEYLLPLADVPWQVELPVESGGCNDCPHFRRRGTRGAWCAGAACYRDRMLEEWPALVDTYPPEYFTPLSHEDAAVFWESGTLRQDWIDLDAQVPATVLQHFGSRTWEEYLEERLGGAIVGRIMIYLVLHPRTHSKRRIVPGGAVRMLLRQAPLIPAEEVEKKTAEVEEATVERAPGRAQTMEDDDLLARRRLYEVVVAQEEANAAPFESASFLRVLLRGILRSMTAAERLRWAEVVGCPTADADVRLEVIHPRLLPGWLAVACCGDAWCASAAVNTLEVQA